MDGQIETIRYALDSPEIIALCVADEHLALLIHRYGELNYSVHDEAFSFLVETIVGQMLSNKVADVISARLYALCGEGLTSEAILHQDISTLKSVGLSVNKSEYILRMATHIRDHPRFFNELVHLTDAEIIRALTSLHGIGSWSAKMYLIFVLNRLDVLPFEDGAFLRAYKWLYNTEDVTATSIIQRCESWKPYSSLAARYLYRALDTRLFRDIDLQEKLDSLLKETKEMINN